MSVDEMREELDVEEVEQDESLQDDESDNYDDDVEPDDADGETEPDEANEEDDPADELGFSFDDDGEDGDPFAGKPAPDWVKQVRKENRELKRKLREREAQQPQQQELRAKPTLDDFDYDSDAYEQDLQKWLAEKQQHDAKVHAEQQKYQQYDTRYRESVDAVRTKAPDYDEIEETIADVLSVPKQALIKTMADDPARLVYTLGKSPKKLDELMKLDDIRFAKQIVLLEQKMAQTKSRNPTKPKPKSHNLTGGTGTGDTQLAKLEAEAARTGDRSKVVQYKRQMRNKT